MHVSTHTQKGNDWVFFMFQHCAGHHEATKVSLVGVLPPEMWKDNKGDPWAVIGRAESALCRQEESVEGNSEEGKNALAGGTT